MAGGNEATDVSEQYLLNLEKKLSYHFVVKEKRWKESSICYKTENLFVIRS